MIEPIRRERRILNLDFADGVDVDEQPRVVLLERILERQDEVVELRRLAIVGERLVQGGTDSVGRGALHRELSVRPKSPSFIQHPPPIQLGGHAVLQ